MNYIEVNLNISPLYPWSELIIQSLADIGFESFTEENGKLQAYVQKEIFDVSSLDILIQEYNEKEITVKYSVKEIPHQNWNALWESDYQPITVSNQLYIKAPFHEDKEAYALTIEIQPQMSFGTGHHQTTYLLCQALLNVNLKDKNVLDIGTGTGILGILASKLGAKKVFGNDIDATSVENARENCERNDIQNFTIEKGSIEVVPQKEYEIILANINRNIITQQMKDYVSLLAPNGLLFLSGFYESDITFLLDIAEPFSLEAVNISTKDTWALLILKKNN